MFAEERATYPEIFLETVPKFEHIIIYEVIFVDGCSSDKPDKIINTLEQFW